MGAKELKEGKNGDNHAESVGQLTEPELQALNTSKGLVELCRNKNIDIKKVLKTLEYEAELEALQVELIKLQRSIQENNRRVVILFEGRDAAGKGGSIMRFAEHMSPRAMRIIALPKPSTTEKGQWYFQRYVAALPNPGEIRFFDRSWYNRAVVEPVMGFCSKEDYNTFMRQVPEFEHMLYEDGVELVKFWFSISKEEQRKRFDERKTNPLKQWKLSPVDELAQSKWEEYSHYKEEMFSRTHTSFSPWIIVKANNKRKARLESMRHVLSVLDYKEKGEAKVSLIPDPNVILRYHRASHKLD